LNHRHQLRSLITFSTLSVMSSLAYAGPTDVTNKAAPAKAFKHSKVAMATSLNSRSPDYSIAKHLTSGGEICGTTHENGHHLTSIASVDPKVVNARRLQRAQASAMGSAAAQATGENYIIPVVVHVFGDAHNCEQDDGICVTDDIVIDALNRTNQDFQGLNTLDGPVSPEFLALKGALNIEFVLAKTDPNGEPTSGIIRHSDSDGPGLGNGGDNEGVINNAWDNYKYMNIYIANDLYGDGKLNRSGVAWFPSTDMSDKGLARVVYNGSYIGNNANENFRSILTHEFGHWLNLAHTFNGGTCDAQGITFCSIEGDSVCDTPQISSSRMQNNAPNCTGQPTNTENFMHYSDNYALFTEQQVQRMTAALYHDSRATLWSDENLQATGLGEYQTDGQMAEWDGITGSDQRPAGELLLEVSELSAAKDNVTVYEFEVPVGTQAAVVYLDGFAQDPDLYVAHGQPPAQDENGQWTQDFVSFKGTDNNEAIGILTPKTAGKYYVAVHAYSAYDNARLSVVAVDDVSICNQCEQIVVHEEKNLSALKGSEPKRFSFEVPDSANMVSFEMPGGYLGDPDLEVSFNAIPQVDVADCLPWKAPGVRERCEFRGDNLGGTYNILINPFSDYANASLIVRYSQVNPSSDGANTKPKAVTASAYAGLEGQEIAFDGSASSDIDGTITSLAWDFGDGQTSDEANPSHTYASYGQYPVTLTVTDDDLDTNTIHSTVLVAKTSEYCQVTANNEFDHIQMVTLADLDNRSNASANDGYDDFSALTATLVEGDNTLTLMGAGALSGTPEENWTVWIDYNGNNDFSDEGEKVVMSTATGVNSHTVTIPAELQGLTTRMRVAMRYENHAESSCEAIDAGEFEDYTVHINAKPIANANGDYTGETRSAVNFSSEGSSDAEGDIASYAWDFGNGHSSTAANPAVGYQTAGTYTVTLTVTDSHGFTATDSTSVTVTEQPQPKSGGSFGIMSALLMLLWGGRRRKHAKA
jgi:PKD repeat protein